LIQSEQEKLVENFPLQISEINELVCNNYMHNKFAVVET